MDEISVHEMKKLEVEKSTMRCLHVTVMDKGTVTKYKDKMLMATVIFADETDCVKALVYDMEKLALMIVGHGLQLQNYIIKQDCIVINKYTEVYLSSPKEIPQDVLSKVTQTARKDFTTLEASLSPKKTTIGNITGIVAKVGLVNLCDVKPSKP